jgi:hypothetical protein
VREPGANVARTVDAQSSFHRYNAQPIDRVCRFCHGLPTRRTLWQQRTPRSACELRSGTPPRFGAHDHVAVERDLAARALPRTLDEQSQFVEPPRSSSWLAMSPPERRRRQVRSRIASMCAQRRIVVE